MAGGRTSRRVVAHLHGDVHVPLPIGCIDDALDGLAAVDPGAPALVDRAAGVRWDRGALRGAVRRAAAWLAGCGVRPGDRVVLCGENSWAWVTGFLACAHTGAVAVPLNPALGAAELAVVLGDVRPHLVLGGGTWRGRDRRGDLETACATAGCAAPVWLDTVGWDIHAAGAAVPAAVAPEPSTVRAGAPRCIVPTSGTTGRPKGVVLGDGQLLANALLGSEPIRLRADDRVVVPVPCFHVFGITLGVLAPLLRGATVVLPAPSFDPAATLTAVQEERGSVVYGVPTMFTALLEHPRLAQFDRSSLRAGVVGGALCPPALAERVVRELPLPGLVIGYGMTETSPCATSTAVGDAFTHVGRPLPHTEVCVADPTTGVTVAFGEQGEVCIRGYLVTRGYWGDDAATAAAVDADGWMHTGDLGVLHHDGCLEVRGRAKDLVIRGGENVDPAEVEAVLQAHPWVAEAAVVAAPDPYLGEEVAAFVRVRCDAVPATVGDPSPAVLTWCRDRLAHFKVPRHLWFVEELPVTGSGKVRKHELRAQAAALVDLTRCPRSSGTTA